MGQSRWPGFVGLAAVGLALILLPLRAAADSNYAPVFGGVSIVPDIEPHVDAAVAPPHPDVDLLMQTGVTVGAALGHR
jgi:hypothetical protein